MTAPCHACAGMGVCAACHGDGKVKGRGGLPVKCHDCGGSGECPDCREGRDGPGGGEGGGE